MKKYVKKTNGDIVEVDVPWYLDRGIIEKIITLLFLIFTALQAKWAKDESKDAKTQSEANGAIVQKVSETTNETHARIGQVQKEVEIQTRLMRPPFGVPEGK